MLTDAEVSALPDAAQLFEWRDNSVAIVATERDAAQEKLSILYDLIRSPGVTKAQIVTEVQKSNVDRQRERLLAHLAQKDLERADLQARLNSLPA